MKLLIRLTASLLTAVLLVLVVGLLVLTTLSFEVDATSHKDWIADAVGDRTGLVIRVDGELYLRFGPRLGVRAEALHLLNPNAERAGELLSAEKASLEVETVPLLSGKLFPTALELGAARIAVERDRSGRFNWQLGADKPPPAADTDDTRKALLLLDALKIRVRNSRLVYDDKRSGASWDVRLETGDMVPEGDSLRVDLDGSLNGSPIRLKGTTITLSGLIAAEEPVPLNMTGNLLGLQVEAKGSVANPWSGAAVSASVSLAGKSLRGFQPWLGDGLAAQGPVKARLTVKGKGGAYRFEPFDLEIGKGRFDGVLIADFSGKRPRLDLELGIEQVDVRPLFSADAARDRRARRSAQVFPDEPFPTAWMDAADVKARIRIRNLTTPYATGRRVDLDLSLQDRRLNVDLEGKAIGDRRVTANLEIDGNRMPMRAVLHLKGDKLQLEPLLVGTEAHGLIRGDLDVSADVQAAGASPEALTSNLEGDVLLLVEQAQADVKGLDRMAGGTNALVGQLVTPTQKLAKVNCGVAAFRFEAGRTKVRAVVDTPYSTVVSTGKLDLGAETLDVRVVPDPKGVTLSVATPVVVRGSLAAPTIRVEQSGLVLTLTELASRIAVPHLLLVDAFGDAVAENPCVRIAAGRVEEQGVKPLDIVTKPVKGVAKGAGAVVKGTGTVLKEAGSAVLKGAGGLVDGLVGGGQRNARTPSKDTAGDKNKPLFEAE